MRHCGTLLLRRPHYALLQCLTSHCKMFHCKTLFAEAVSSCTLAMPNFDVWTDQSMLILCNNGHWLPTTRVEPSNRWWFTTPFRCLSITMNNLFQDKKDLNLATDNFIFLFRNALRDNSITNNITLLHDNCITTNSPNTTNIKISYNPVLTKIYINAESC